MPLAMPHSERTEPPEIDRYVQGCARRFDLEGGCFYHRSTAFLERGGIVPRGASPSLLYFLYPYLLASSYGGVIPEDRRYRHPETRPGAHGVGLPVTIERGRPHLRDRLLNLVKTILVPVKPIGRIRCQPAVVTGGGAFPFDLGSEGTLCPAAWRSALPFLAREAYRAARDEVDPAWRVVCPDHVKNVVCGAGEPDDVFYDSICTWGDGTEVAVKAPCSRGVNPEADSLDAISALLSFPCPSLLNVAYGYYLTLCTGGELGFSARSLKAAVFQCPNPRSKVVLRIRKGPRRVDFDVLDVVGRSCPRAIAKGDRFHLPSEPRENRFCLDAFNALFPYAGLCEAFGGSVLVRCVFEGCGALYEVRSRPG